MSNQPNEQTIILKEILKWVKFAGLKEVKELLLTTTNNDPKKLLVYHLGDGNHGANEIASLLSIGNKTVLGLWELWLKMGLGENVPVKGGSRFKRSFDLQEIGIEVPEIKEVIQSKNAPTGQSNQAEKNVRS
ncbi:MAG: hypothetical protein ACFCUE_10955 [Candidatus Bathyarchaeia archaeon]|jgi:hypothetical protein